MFTLSVIYGSNTVMNQGGRTVLSNQEPLPAITDISRYCGSYSIKTLFSDLLQESTTTKRRFDRLIKAEKELFERIPDAGFAELGEIHTKLTDIELERFQLSSSVAPLHKQCTEYRDLLAKHTVELLEAECMHDGHGAPPCRYTLISMGSDGRQEQTLITDQDYLIVYDDNGGEGADAWFEHFGSRLVDRLEEVGFARCTGGIMTSNPTWRGSYSQWRKRLFAIVRYEVEDFAKNMMDLIVLSDARYVTGDQVLGERLIELIRDLEREHFQVMWGMARAATEMKLALGFMRKLWVEPTGEHKGEFNIKLLAWAPLVMNVRILAISLGLKATNTIERINFLEGEGSFSPEMAQGLREAYYLLTKQRIHLQIKQIQGLQKDSYYLDPLLISHDEREDIRQAVIRIEELQKLIHTNFNIV